MDLLFSFFLFWMFSTFCSRPQDICIMTRCVCFCHLCVRAFSNTIFLSFFLHAKERGLLETSNLYITVYCHCVSWSLHIKYDSDKNENID